MIRRIYLVAIRHRHNPREDVTYLYDGREVAEGGGREEFRKPSHSLRESSVIIDSHNQQIRSRPYPVSSRRHPHGGASVNKLPRRLSFGDIAKFGIYLNLNFR